MTKPLLYQGEIVAYVQEYSDAMMALLLAGRRPEKYAKQRLEHSGRVDSAVSVREEAEALRKLTPE